MNHMAHFSFQNLKAVRFEGELLPTWAQLLDVASRLCRVSEETCRWFSSLTTSNGVDDARTVRAHCEALRAELIARREQILGELRREREDARSTQILAAWLYALDTISSRQVAKRRVPGKLRDLTKRMITILETVVKLR